MISEKQEQKFLAYIEKNMQVQLITKSNNIYYFHYIGKDEYGGAAAYIAGAKHIAQINPEDIQVLVEYPTSIGKRKYVCHGHHMIIKMLSEIYGGYVSLKLYWILNNISNNRGNNPFGYNNRIRYVDEIEAEVITAQINIWLKGCFLAAPQTAQIEK